MTGPLVSVKMITYNHLPFITQAIEGVLQQKTTFPFELVIGEDCSTDGTREIVFDYQKKHPDIIRVVTSDKNVGMKKNGLRTLEACQGKYIAFCEGDDFWHHPGKLQKQVDYMESHPQCGLVFTECDIYLQREGKVVRNVNCSHGFRSPMHLNIEQIIEQGGKVVKTCSVMGRRKLIEQVSAGDPYLHQNEKFLMGDTQLFAELALISKVSYYPESLATYRIHDESATRSRDPKRVARFQQNASEMKLYLCDKHGLSASIRRRFESDWCNSSLFLAFFERNAALAEEVRKKKTFTFKEWLLYYGAKNLMLNHFLRLAALCRNLLRRRWAVLKTSGASPPDKGNPGACAESCEE
jgi:glycosyltransferase involved in cell wall biosynthesis